MPQTVSAAEGLPGPRQRQQHLTRWLQQQNFRALSDGDRLPTTSKKLLRVGSYGLASIFFISVVCFPATPIGSLIAMAILGTVAAKRAPEDRLKYLWALPTTTKDIALSQLRFVSQRATFDLFLIVLLTFSFGNTLWVSDREAGLLYGFFYVVTLVLIFYWAVGFTTLWSLVKDHRHRSALQLRFTFIQSQSFLLLVAQSSLRDLTTLDLKTIVALDLGILVSLGGMFWLTWRSLGRSISGRPPASGDAATWRSVDLLVLGCVIFVSIWGNESLEFWGNEPLAWRWAALSIFGFTVLAQFRRAHSFAVTSLALLVIAIGLEVALFQGFVSLLHSIWGQWFLTLIGCVLLHRQPAFSQIPRQIDAPRRRMASPNEALPRRNDRSSVRSSTSPSVYEEPIAVVPYLSRHFRRRLLKGMGLMVIPCSLLWLFVRPETVHLEGLLFLAVLLLVALVRKFAFENRFVASLPISTSQLVDSTRRAAIGPLFIFTGCLLLLLFTAPRLIEEPLQAVRSGGSWQHLALPGILIAMLIFSMPLAHPYKHRLGLPDRWIVAAILQGWAALNSRSLASNLHDLNRWTELLVHVLSLSLLVAIAWVSARVFSKQLKKRASLIVYFPEGTSTLGPGMLAFLTLIIVLWVPDGWAPVFLWSLILAYGAASLTPRFDLGGRPHWLIRATPIILVVAGVLALTTFFVNGASGNERIMWTQLFVSYGWFIAQTAYELHQMKTRRDPSNVQHLEPFFRLSR